LTIKEEVIKMIEEFPEDITISDIMAELYFRQNVDERNSMKQKSSAREKPKSG
jgi:hypothetical protein